MPLTAFPLLDPLKISHQLPVGHGLIEGLLLETRAVQIVLDHPLPKASRADPDCSSAAIASRRVFGTWGSVASS